MEKMQEDEKEEIEELCGGLYVEERKVRDYECP